MDIPNEIYTIVREMWPTLLLFIVVMSIVRICYLIEKKEKFKLYKEFFMLMFVLYILLLFGLVTNRDLQSVSHNFIPFKEIMRYELGSKLFYLNVIGNIVIFLPFGLFTGIYLNTNSVKKPLFIVLITSLTIEVIQTFIGRSFDVDDIILNVTGGIIGFLIYKVFKSIKNHLPKFLKSDWLYNTLTLLLIVIIIFYVLKFLGVIV